MAESDSQKQFLTLIRDLATEKSQEARFAERRVVALQKRKEELQSEMAVANVELEESKRSKEATEQELKGYEVEVAMNDALIQTLEQRNSAIQYEISMVRSDVEALKNEERSLRDNFIKEMLELNAKIRRFQESWASTLHKESPIAALSDDGNGILTEKDAQRTHEDELVLIISELNKEEQEYQAELNLHEQLQEELINTERKVALMEAILNETKELQELTKQTSELEKTCNSLAEELQRKCMCPNCSQKNVEALRAILGANKNS